MQVKVNKEFVDKHTGELHKVGEIFEVTDKRLAEIQKVDKDMVQVAEPAPVSSTSDDSKEKKGMKKDV